MSTKRTKRPAAKKEEAMTFAWKPLPPPEKIDAFEKTAQRVAAAVDEINAAIKEAHDNTEMRVEIWTEGDAPPRRYQYRIYRLTHSVMRFNLNFGVPDQPGKTDFWKGLFAPIPKPEKESAE